MLLFNLNNWDLTRCEARGQLRASWHFIIWISTSSSTPARHNKLCARTVHQTQSELGACVCGVCLKIYDYKVIFFLCRRMRHFMGQNNALWILCFIDFSLNKIKNFYWKNTLKAIANMNFGPCHVKSSKQEIYKNLIDIFGGFYIEFKLILNGHRSIIWICMVSIISWHFLHKSSLWVAEIFWWMKCEKYFSL